MNSTIQSLKRATPALSEHLGVRLEPALKAELVALCAREGVTVSKLVAYLVREFVEKVNIAQKSEEIQAVKKVA